MQEKLTLTQLNKAYDKLQKKYGVLGIDPIYSGGQVQNPETLFIFMNPTAANVASSPDWKGLKAPWLGTKNIWKLFNMIRLFNDDLYQEILSMKAVDWNPEFAIRVYEEVARNRIYITNLAKCTQSDAKPLNNALFKEYIPLLEEEISILKPKRIVTLGNQVSSLFLGMPISVSKVRKKLFDREVKGTVYKVQAVYYPVGQGMRNIGKAAEDLLANQL